MDAQPRSRNLLVAASAAFQALAMNAVPLQLRAAALEREKPAATANIKSQVNIPLEFELYMVANSLYKVGISILLEMKDQEKLAADALKDFLPTLPDAERGDMSKQSLWMQANADRALRVIDPHWPMLQQAMKNGLLPPYVEPPPPDTSN